MTVQLAVCQLLSSRSKSGGLTISTVEWGLQEAGSRPSRLTVLINMRTTIEQALTTGVNLNLLHPHVIDILFDLLRQKVT